MNSSHDLFMPSEETRRSSCVIQESELKALGMSDREITQCLRLRQRYLEKPPLCWDQISPPSEDFFHSYEDLKQVDHQRAKEILSKLVIIELNGGLGLRLGCKGPKSALHILKESRDNSEMTFLDCKELNKKYGVDIPLVLMNSFNTDEKTKEMIQKYKGRGVTIRTFVQSKYPVLAKETLAPIPTSSDQSDAWYPPGSGDVFASLNSSGLLDEFLSAGKEFLFLANVENLGATCSPKILNHLVEEGLDFLVEVTDRISTDKGGGFAINYNLDERIHILETSQIPPELTSAFSLRDYKFWNTNNLWVRMKPVQNLLRLNALAADFIVKTRQWNHRTVLQLETPAAMAIQSFKKAAALKVPRMRYRPIKTTSELLQAQSDLFQLDGGMLKLHPSRVPPTIPLVKLGDSFAALEDYEKRMPVVPHILELDHLTVSGDVRFGPNVTLKGTVIIVADTGSVISIPEGTVLENKIIAGELIIQDY